MPEMGLMIHFLQVLPSCSTGIQRPKNPPHSTNMNKIRPGSHVTSQPEPRLPNTDGHKSRNPYFIPLNLSSAQD